MEVKVQPRPSADRVQTAPAGAPSAARFAGALTGVVVASWVPVPVGANTRAAVGWIVALVLAAAVAWVSLRLNVTVLVAALVASSALVPSGLVTEATHYMPVAVTGGALAIRLALDARHQSVPALPPTPIVVTVGLYLVWSAITTVTSIDHRTSLVYLAGLIAVCTLAFWLIPDALADAGERDRLLAAVGALGAVVAVSVYVVSIFGGFSVFGRELGFYREVALTLGGRPTGVHFGYSSGAFLAPLEPSVIMAVGVLALLGWSAKRSGREAAVALIAIVFMAPAILVTLDRSAWLAVIVGAGAFVVLARQAKVVLGAAPWVCGFFAVLFLLVFVNAVGAVAVTNGCTTNCTSNNPQNTIRGGTGLSGREFLWKASIDAIKHRPVFGYGAGNNVPAIEPYLTGDAVKAGYSLGGLTSHSTWFRTAVELGIPGLLLLVAVLAAVAWLFVRGLVSGGRPDATRIAFAAIVTGLLPAMTFETFILGGVTFSSLVLTVAAGLVTGPEAARSSKGMLPG